MTHIHTIEDHDKHFVVDPITKKIQPENPEKNKLVRYDHNSERYTFEMDRMIEGHDMSLCDIVQIHYINISSNKQSKNEDVYEVGDLGLLKENDNKIAFTWLISRNATMLDGILTFAIRFACSNNEVIEYELHTEIFSSISISNTIFNNGQAIIEEYSDILNQWKKELFSIEGTIQRAKQESLEAIESAKNDTLNAIGEYGCVQVSKEEPTNPNVDLYINPNSKESCIIPEIKDDLISDEDTWSSKKIDTDFSKLKEDIVKKLDKNQGAENNGKILGIGADGMLVPVDKPSGGTGGEKDYELISEIITSQEVSIIEFKDFLKPIKEYIFYITCPKSEPISIYIQRVFKNSKFGKTAILYNISATDKEIDTYVKGEIIAEKVEILENITNKWNSGNLQINYYNTYEDKTQISVGSYAKLSLICTNQFKIPIGTKITLLGK